MLIEELLSPLTLVEQRLQRWNRAEWITEARSPTVEVVASAELENNRWLQVDQVKSRYRNFVQTKLDNPMQPFGKRDYPFHGVMSHAANGERLRHAHLTQDLSIVYSVSGDQVKTVKIYDIASHKELGTETTPSRRKQAQWVASKTAVNQWQPVGSFGENFKST